MKRLSPDHLPASIAPVGYDRNARRIGIVHFGLGAFARAHLAWYSDRAMALAGGDWLVAGVSLRSPTVAAQLDPQGGLYTLAERSGTGVRRQLVGSLAEMIVAPDAPQRVTALLTARETAIVSFTITEKGYCRAMNGSLDPVSAAGGSIYPLLAQGLAARRRAGMDGLTLLSCDNLAGNGQQLFRLLGDYLAANDPALADWVAAHCTFPGTMVDRIVPATTEDDRADAAAALGLRDEALVVTEPFSQWVIEDRFAGPRPAWEQAGVEIVADVAPYENAKLRMLNGAHSALAYCGLRAGHAHVHEAVADPVLCTLVERLMREEAAPTIAKAPGQDLAAYADRLLARFTNPALNHRLIQIAMDGSQKIPQRWLETLAINQRLGRRCPAILTALAAWLHHIRGENGPVIDPMAGELARLWQAVGRAGIIPVLFGPQGIISTIWTPTDADIASVLEAL